jgi:hypothetical protein
MALHVSGTCTRKAWLDAWLNSTQSHSIAWFDKVKFAVHHVLLMEIYSTDKDKCIHYTNKNEHLKVCVYIIYYFLYYTVYKRKHSKLTELSVMKYYLTNKYKWIVKYIFYLIFIIFTMSFQFVYM